MRGFYFTIIFSFFLSGCTYHVVKDGGTGSDGKFGDSLPADKVIGYELIHSAVINNCLGCHSGSRPPDLSSLALVRTHGEAMWGEISSNAMPPPSSGLPPLSTCRKAVFRKWLDLGAPETSVVTVGDIAECPRLAPETPIAQMPLNYQTLRDRIIVRRCQQCHNPTDQTDAGVILFSTYADLMDGEHRWSEPAAESKVVRLLRTEDLEERMPPPEAGAALAEDEIQFIERWIDAGKPEF